MKMTIIAAASDTPNGNGFMTVTLSAQDEPGGSGVAETYYQVIGAHAAPQHYSAPFRLSPGATVRFASSDRAGNTETIKEFPSQQAATSLYLPLVIR
jgi:cytochrome c